VIVYNKFFLGFERVYSFNKDKLAVNAAGARYCRLLKVAGARCCSHPQQQHHGVVLSRLQWLI